MTFELKQLPFKRDALAPHISARTIDYHYDKHHAGYVDTLNDLVSGTGYENTALEEIILKSFTQEDEQDIFNNAAQVWNHDFFWDSLSPDGGGNPEGELGRLIERDFGSYKDFRDAFEEAGTSEFGSGWVWLVIEAGKLKTVSTTDARLPLLYGQQPLICCDVWEHAYYLDYQNERNSFLTAFLDSLINWEHATEQLSIQGEGTTTAARGYQDAQADFARSGPVDKKAREAADALDDEEGEELRKAEENAADRS